MWQIIKLAGPKNKAAASGARESRRQEEDTDEDEDIASEPRPSILHNGIDGSGVVAASPEPSAAWLESQGKCCRSSQKAGRGSSSPKSDLGWRVKTPRTSSSPISQGEHQVLSTEVQRTHHEPA